MIFLFKLEAVLTNIASIDKVTQVQSGEGGNIESNISLGCKSPAVNTGESVERSRSGERDKGCNKTVLYPHYYEVLQHVDRYQC